MVKQQKGVNKKLQTLLNAPGDKASDLVWVILKPTLLYSAELVGEISDDIVAIDQAMKWGFGWEVGPFETWDAIGLRKSVGRMQKEGDTVPRWVLNLLEDGYESFYKYDSHEDYFYDQGEYKLLPHNKKEINIQRLKESKGVIKHNPGASLIDMGDGVALLEFHSKSNALGIDSIQMIHSAIEEVEKIMKDLLSGIKGETSVSVQI